jgi:hypothetical protein
MPKELFNQDLIEAPDLPDNNDRTAFGQPGTPGGLNMKWGYFKTVIATESRSFTAKNNTGGQIDKGEVVYISGEDSGVPEVTLAQADAEATAITAIGIAINDIADTETGSFLTIGTLTDIDTSTFAAGDSLWLSAATAGALTNVKPSSPNFAIFVGSVRTDSATGEIQVQFKSLTEAGAGANKIQSTSGDSYAEFGNSGADEFLTIVADTIKAQRISGGNSRTSTLLNGQTVENIIDGSTTAAAATLTKTGENFLTTVNIGDVVLVYGGTTTADYGTYIVRSVDSDIQLTVDRNFTGTNSDVDFDILTGGTLIENAIEDGVSNIRSNAIYLDVQQKNDNTTGLWFSDEDTGIWSDGAQLNFVTNGLLRWAVGVQFMGNVETNRPSFRHIAAAANAPNIVPRNNDLDTGISSAAADQLSLIAGGIEGIRLDEATNPGFVKTIINPDGAVGLNTGLWFGDADTGLWEAADDNMIFTIGGFNIYNFTSTYIRSAKNSNGFQLSPDAATATIPTLIPSRADTNTGVGWAIGDQLSLIAGAQEGIRIEEASDNIILKYHWDTGITASTTQSQGQQVLLSSRNEVSTVANANDVVTMPAADRGREVFIVNNGANTLQIFPSSGDDLGAGVDTSVTLASGASVLYEAYDATNWATK